MFEHDKLLDKLMGAQNEVAAQLERFNDKIEAEISRRNKLMYGEDVYTQTIDEQTHTFN
jgi:hypothetical protein